MGFVITDMIYIYIYDIYIYTCVCVRACMYVYIYIYCGDKSLGINGLVTIPEYGSGYVYVIDVIQLLTMAFWNERISMLCILVSYESFGTQLPAQFSEPPIQNRCLRFAHFALLMGGESPIIGGWSWIYGWWLPRHITIDFLTWRYFNLLARLDIFGGKFICWCLNHMGPMCSFFLEDSKC